MSDQSLVRLIYDAHRILTELEAAPRDYGGGRLLYASEVHALVEIDKQPGINLTGLAERLRVSKSAVSKVTKKLLAGHFIDSERLPGNRKEIHFFVSQLGAAAAAGHREFEARLFGPLFEREARLGTEDRNVVASFLGDLYRLLKE
jgi:DNA-binding MarR family transcriptional regulator